MQEHERLSALIGTWKTEGWTHEAPGAPSIRVDAVDVYEPLDGGLAVLHRVDARMGDDRVRGAEIIGYDPARRAFVTQYFGTDGPNRYEASLTEERGNLVWRMWSASDRFIGLFGDDGKVIVGHWERLDGDGRWEPWMDITLTRQPS